MPKCRERLSGPPYKWKYVSSSLTLGTTNMQTYIYYNTSLPEGTYEATVKGNLVNLVIEGVLSSVLAIAGGSIAGVAVDTALDILERETGIVSDLGILVDDVVDTFKFW